MLFNDLIFMEQHFVVACLLSRQSCNNQMLLSPRINSDQACLTPHIVTTLDPRGDVKHLITG